MWVRLALQGAGCAIAYSYLECAFQKVSQFISSRFMRVSYHNFSFYDITLIQGHKRTIFDAALAGAIAGGAYGLRGIPGMHTKKT